MKPCLILFLLCSSLWADTLVLTNGQRFEGVLESVSDREVVLNVGGGRLRFPRSQVAEILRDSGDEVAPAASGAEHVDPYALVAEPHFFAGQSFWLPPARIFLEKPLAELPELIPLSVDCLGQRFATRPGAGVVLVAVERDSPAHRGLQAVAWGARVELQLDCSQQTRRPGGIEQTWTLLRVQKLRTWEEKSWSELHTGYDRVQGQSFTLFLRFAEPLILGELGPYSQVAAESEPDFVLGNPERPAGWLNPVVLTREHPQLPSGPLGGFCRVRVRIAQLEVEDPDRGVASAGLAIIEEAQPLLAAEDFGAPPLLTGGAGGSALDGSLLTDPVALSQSPERFVGQTLFLPGQAWLGGSFERDRALEGLRVVELSSVAASFGRDAHGGQVVLVAEQHGSVERTLARLGYQARVILEVRVQEQRRRLGGVLEIGYFLGRVVGVQRWSDSDWFGLSHRWQELRGQRLHLLLRPEGLLAADLFLDSGERPLLASYTDQHRTNFGQVRPGELVLALPQDPASEARLAPLLAEASGFCRLEVEIGEGVLAGDTVGVARVLDLQPLQTRNAVDPAADGTVRSFVAYHKLLPDKDDLQQWFERRGDELRRNLYRDLSSEEMAGPPWRYRLVDRAGSTRLCQELPAAVPQRLWERGSRTKLVSHSTSYFSGPNTITTLDWGTSRTTVTTWLRLLWNPATAAWEQPSLEASEARLAELAQAAEQLRPARNRFVQTIIAVEERGRLRFLRDDVARRADMIAHWESSESLQGPAARERLAEMRVELAERQAERRQLQEDYALALAGVRDVGVLYQAFLNEAADFASGALPPIGYE